MSTKRLLYNRPLLSLLLFSFVLLSAVGIHEASQASVLPDFVRLPPVADQVSSPTSVAFDDAGRLYVAESGTNSVVVLSQGGKFISRLTGLVSPISVAVDSLGRLYVGSKEKGHVAVYDADFNFLFKLNFRDGEFNQPNDIAIDASGMIYVVDKGNDIVKIYNSEGHPAGTIGISGNGNGQFFHPVSIAIDELADEIVVLDRQQVPGKSMEGARVQFFDMSGAFLRGFSKYGKLVGDMARPQHVTVDNASRLYVTDSLQNVVLVYDNLGAYLGAVFDVVNPLRTPLGITVSDTNRLYIASLLDEHVEVYGLDQYSLMTVSPVSLTYNAVEGAADPPAQTVSVSNEGRTVISWAAASNDGWISLNDTAGVADIGQTVTFDASVASGGLSAGEHTGNLSISGGPATTEVVSVTLNIMPTAILSVTPPSLSLSAEAGSTASDMATVANNGSAPLQWSISADQPWLSFSQGSGTIADSGTIPQQVTVTADTSSLGVGDYNGTVTVSGGADTATSPAVIAVSLSVTEPPPPPVPTAEDRVIEEMAWTLSETNPAVTDPGISFHDVWGSSASSIYVVGDEGTILRSDGAAWHSMENGSRQHLLGIWGSSDTDVYAVGNRGTLLHYDGTAWSSEKLPIKVHLNDVWGSSGSDVYAVGNRGTLLHYDGTEWSSEKLPIKVHLNDVWGSSGSDVYAVGDRGTLLHYDGAEWHFIETGSKRKLFGVWGSSENDVYVVGEFGVILHYDGVSWGETVGVTDEDLHGVWGSSATDLFVVGKNGSILYNDGNGFQIRNTGIIDSLNGVWGSPATTDVIAVGANGAILHGKQNEY